MKTLISFFVLLVLAAAAFAQKGSVTAEADFSGSLAPTVVDLPLPAYPGVSKKADLGGRVSVAVTIDDAGKIATADDADGPYPICISVADPGVLALRKAAIEAAKKAVFKPAMNGSQPAWSKGRINYTFIVHPKPVKSSPDKNAKPDTTGAQIDLNSTPRGSTEGALNGKAREIPQPARPSTPGQPRVYGSVRVQVLIGEDGSMRSAEALTGPSVLRKSAEIAACRAKFAPTLFGGYPVKVSGVITYNFVP